MLQDEHFEYILDDRSSSSIIRGIRRLKIEKNRLKKDIERPRNGPWDDPIFDEKERIQAVNALIEKGKEQLEKWGEPYKPTVQETAAMTFQNNIEHISKIYFSLGDDERQKQISISLSDILTVAVESEPCILLPLRLENPKLTKDDFLAVIRSLHMGEWHRNYDIEKSYDEDFEVYGVWWKIKIEYNNGQRATTFKGTDLYPYNISEFTKLFFSESIERYVLGIDFSIPEEIEGEIAYDYGILEYHIHEYEHPLAPYNPLRMKINEQMVKRLRKNIEKAKLYLEEMGVLYKPNKAEKIAAIFDNNIPYISKFTYSIGSMDTGVKTDTIVIQGDELIHTVEKSITWESKELSPMEKNPLTKNEFFDLLKHIHMGEWRYVYKPEDYGESVLDGTTWHIEIEYSNGAKPVKYMFKIAYPFGFTELSDLFRDW